MPSETTEHETEYPDDLIRRATAGDRLAFGELYRGLYPRVHRTVWGMMGSESEAHDVAQTAWIKAWDKRERFNFQSKYSTWVHRIAINCALDALRSRRRLHRRIVSFFSAGEGDTLPDPPETGNGAHPDKQLQNRELGQLIEAAVAELPESQRTVLVLREYEGYSYAEIATALNIQPGTVMSRLHLARQKLQTRLSKELS